VITGVALLSLVNPLLLFTLEKSCCLLGRFENATLLPLDAAGDFIQFAPIGYED
jgi:hypothetical protein